MDAADRLVMGANRLYLQWLTEERHRQILVSSTLTDDEKKLLIAEDNNNSGGGGHFDVPPLPLVALQFQDVPITVVFVALGATNAPPADGETLISRECDARWRVSPIRLM